MDSLPWLDGSDAIVPNSRVRVLTNDPDTTSRTMLWQAPPGWSARHEGLAAAVEIFVLSGDLQASTLSARSGGFIALQPCSTPVELSTRAGCEAVMFVTANWREDASYDGQSHMSSVWKQDWIGTIVPGYSPGILHKSLRWPDRTGSEYQGRGNGLLRMVMLAAGYRGVREAHNCWEEIVVLAGDLFMPTHGATLGPASFIVNPAEFEHGPFVTGRGAVLLVHSEEPIAAIFPDIDSDELEAESVQTCDAYHLSSSWASRSGVQPP